MTTIISYHIQVVIIQFLAFLGYKWLLADMPFGQFKRWYLLITIGVSFFVPGWIVIESTPLMHSTELYSLEALSNSSGDLDIVTTQDNHSWVHYVFFLYMFGVLVSLVIFLSRCFVLLRQRWKATSIVKYRCTSIITLNENIPVHTFGKWIFTGGINSISPTILAHEYIHAGQWHSADRLFIRLLIIFHWFNPIMYLYERAIIYNHEFIADHGAMLSTGLTVEAYQQELLGSLAPSTQTIPLSSFLSYLLTKKRLLMLTKNQYSRIHIIGKFTLLIGLWGCLLFTFAERTSAQSSNSSDEESLSVPAEQKQKEIEKELTVEEYLMKRYEVEKSKNPLLPPPVITVANSDIKHLPLSEWRQLKYEQFMAESPLPPNRTQLTAFQNAKKYRVWIDGVESRNELVANYKPEDIFKYTMSKPRKNPKNLISVGLITHDKRAKTAIQLKREAGL